MALPKIFKSLTFWLVVALAVCVGVIYFLAQKNATKEAEIARLDANQTALLGEVEYYQSENGELVASVQSLTMQRDEFEQMFKAESKKVESLNVRIKDLESFGEIATDTEVDIEAEIVPVVDTIYVAEPIVGTFEWNDGWVRLVGELHPDHLTAKINITDTITIVAHRKAKQWLFFRCKGKITHYDALSSNPHTNISNIRYVELTE